MNLLCTGRVQKAISHGGYFEIHFWTKSAGVKNHKDACVALFEGSLTSLIYRLTAAMASRGVQTFKARKWRSWTSFLMSSLSTWWFPPTQPVCSSRRRTKSRLLWNRNIRESTLWPSIHWTGRRILTAWVRWDQFLRCFEGNGKIIVQRTRLRHCRVDGMRWLQDMRSMEVRRWLYCPWGQECMDLRWIRWDTWQSR